MTKQKRLTPVVFAAAVLIGAAILLLVLWGCTQDGNVTVGFGNHSSTATTGGTAATDDNAKLGHNVSVPKDGQESDNEQPR